MGAPGPAVERGSPRGPSCPRTAGPASAGRAATRPTRRTRGGSSPARGPRAAGPERATNADRRPPPSSPRRAPRLGAAGPPRRETPRGAVGRRRATSRSPHRRAARAALRQRSRARRSASSSATASRRRRMRSRSSSPAFSVKVIAATRESSTALVDDEGERPGRRAPPSCRSRPRRRRRASSEGPSGCGPEPPGRERASETPSPHASETPTSDPPPFPPSGESSGSLRDQLQKRPPRPGSSLLRSTWRRRSTTPRPSGSQ